MHEANKELVANMNIDRKADRYPYCIVWTPLPLITYVQTDE